MAVIAETLSYIDVFSVPLPTSISETQVFNVPLAGFVPKYFGVPPTCVTYYGNSVDRLQEICLLILAHYILTRL